MLNAPGLSDEEVAAALWRLAEHTSRLDEKSCRHLVGVTQEYLAMPPGEFRTDYLRYAAKIMSADAMAYLDAIRAAPLTEMVLPAELADIVNTITERPLDVQRTMLASWSYELHMNEKWDRTLEDTADDCVAIFRTGPDETRH